MKASEQLLAMAARADELERGGYQVTGASIGLGPPTLTIYSPHGVAFAPTGGFSGHESDHFYHAKPGEVRLHWVVARAAA